TKLAQRELARRSIVHLRSRDFVPFTDTNVFVRRFNERVSIRGNDQELELGTQALHHGSQRTNRTAGAVSWEEVFDEGQYSGPLKRIRDTRTLLRASDGHVCFYAAAASSR